MSQDDKTLLPEFLPPPQQAAGRTPKERVTEQARLLLQRFRSVGVMAGTAILSVQCGSGYGVVDPLPNPPAQCSTLTAPIPPIYTNASVGSSGDGIPPITLDVKAYAVIGLRIDAVRVTGGTLVSTVDQTTSGPGGSTLFVVTIAPDASSAPLLVDVDLGCGADPSTTTKHHRLTPQAGTSAVTVTEVMGSQL